MSSRNMHLAILIGSLVVISLFVFTYRYAYLGVPLYPEQQIKSWTVETSLKFNPQPNKPVKVSLTIPNQPPYFAVLDEYFVSNGYGVSTSVDNNNRQTVWSKRRATGTQTVYYRGIFRHLNQSEASASTLVPMTKTPLSDSDKSAAQAITDEARKLSADIETFAIATITQLHRNNDNVRALRGRDNRDEAVAKGAIKVLQQANIRTTMVKGINFDEERHPGLDTWLAVYNDKEWIYINPKTGRKDSASHFLIWQYGDKPLYELSGGSKPSLNVTVTPSSANALNVAKIRGTQIESNLMKFSLLQLPLSVQETYQVLLTIPVGAFVILMLRNFVGLVTFGTFMPVLVALAFRETHLVWGVILFSFIVSIGLLVRFYLDQLHLLVVPRLATILSVVVFVMIFLSILGQQLGFHIGLSIALFPMVILTMVIERMCITWDERGAFEALKTGGGSLLAASITFVVMNSKEIQYLLFAFPELLLLLMAMTLFFGQYRGYRLFEVLRFNALTKQGA